MLCIPPSIHYMSHQINQKEILNLVIVPKHLLYVLFRDDFIQTLALYCMYKVKQKNYNQKAMSALTCAIKRNLLTHTS